MTAKTRPGLREAREFARNTELAGLERTDKAAFNAVVAKSRDSDDWQAAICEASDEFVKSPERFLEATPNVAEAATSADENGSGNAPVVYETVVKTVTIEIPYQDISDADYCPTKITRFIRDRAKREAWKRWAEALRTRGDVALGKRPVFHSNEAFEWLLGKIAEAISQQEGSSG